MLSLLAWEREAWLVILCDFVYHCIFNPVSSNCSIIHIKFPPRQEWCTGMTSTCSIVEQIIVGMHAFQIWQLWALGKERLEVGLGEEF